MIRFFILLFVIISVQSQSQTHCRGRFGPLLPDVFNYIKCIDCYHYIPNDMFIEKISFKYDVGKKAVTDPRTNESFLLDPENTSTPMYKNFVDIKNAKKWTDCCKAAIKCCQKMLNDPLPKTNKTFCPRTWDGWQCWPDTEAGTTATSICEDHVYFKSIRKCPQYARKKCLSNGHWFYSEEGGQRYEWTDYTFCTETDNRVKSIYFHLSCFGISIVSLVPAIVIFMHYKSLRVHRISIHKNLFVSSLLTAVSVIIFKSVVTLDEVRTESKEYLENNEGWCKFVFIVTKYFRLTNYMWMFCEGFYLHKLIVSAFAEQKNLYLFYFIGWGFPAIIICIYSTLNQIYANFQCWSAASGWFSWITNIPMLLAIAGNLFFLCDINRVLITKLRSNNNPNEPPQYRKAVRATLVLIPLFGLHSFLLIYRPQTSTTCTLLDVYHYFEYAFDGLQGCVVSIIFCYTNGEILSLLKRTRERYRLKKVGGRASIFNSRSFSTVTRASTISTLDPPSNETST